MHYRFSVLTVNFETQPTLHSTVCDFYSLNNSLSDYNCINRIKKNKCHMCDLTSFSILLKNRRWCQITQTSTQNISINWNNYTGIKLHTIYIRTLKMKRKYVENIFNIEKAGNERVGVIFSFRYYSTILIYLYKKMQLA